MKPRIFVVVAFIATASTLEAADKGHLSLPTIIPLTRVSQLGCNASAPVCNFGHGRTERSEALQTFEGTVAITFSSSRSCGDIVTQASQTSGFSPDSIWVDETMSGDLHISGGDPPDMNAGSHFDATFKLESATPCIMNWNAYVRSDIEAAEVKVELLHGADSLVAMRIFTTGFSEEQSSKEAQEFRLTPGNYRLKVSSSSNGFTSSYRSSYYATCRVRLKCNAEVAVAPRHWGEVKILYR